MSQAEQPTLVLTRGAPGSGKSTWAVSWVADNVPWRARVNRDDLRFAMHGAYVLDRMREDGVTVAQHAQVTALLKAGLSVVVDDTNLRAATVRDWYKVADALGVPVEFADFDTPVDVCIARNKARAQAGGREVPEDVIRSFFQRYYHRDGSLPAIPERLEDVSSMVPYVPGDVFRPKAILVDVDGTLARMKDRSPYDWKRVGEDELIDNVAEVVRRLYSTGITIVIMSGRDGSCRAETQDWLLRHEIYYTELHMRAADDMRRDNIVKYELFDKHIRDKYNVVGVIDDRKQVCEMWESIGLTLFRVGPMNADF